LIEGEKLRLLVPGLLIALALSNDFFFQVLHILLFELCFVTAAVPLVLGSFGVIITGLASLIILIVVKASLLAYYLL